MAIMKNTTQILKHSGLSFTTVINQTIEAFADLVGFEALGMYVYLFQKPCGWVINETHLMAYSRRGRKYVRQCMSDLKKIGLLKKEAVKNNKGQIVKWEITLFSQPQDLLDNNHLTEKPLSGDTQVTRKGSSGFDSQVTRKGTCGKTLEKPNDCNAFSDENHMTRKEPPINKDINKEKNISKPFSNSDMLADNPHSFKMEDIDELQANRKRKKAPPLTKRSWDRINRQLTLIVETCSITAYEAIDKMLSDGWLSIDVSYFKPASRAFKSVESNNNPPLENKDDLDDGSTIFLFSEEPDSLEEIKIQIEGCMKIIRNNLPLLCVEIAEKRIVSLNLKLSNLTQ